MPNKTIYVSDGDLPLYQRAQELAGDNLSAAISAALRRYVDVEEGRREGFDEIIVRVGTRPRPEGPIHRRPPRRVAQHVVQPRRDLPRLPWPAGKFVLHTERSPDYIDGRRRGQAGRLARLSRHRQHQLREQRPRESTLEVFETLEELRERIPPQLYDMVASSAQQPAVEDLDI